MTEPMRLTLYGALLIGLVLVATAFSKPTTKPAAEFRGAIPNMMVKDLDAATTFYTRSLGFKQTGGGPNYVVLERDRVTLSLIASKRKTPGQCWCYLTVSDVPPVYAEYQAAKVKFLAPLKDWGRRHVEFTIADPDGNTIDIGN